jgi:EAL domain-containing protein (putative c-di-GMP-specific phosphodiesterase class I)
MASRQFAHPSLPQYVEQALAQSRLDAASLQIEISENVLMENPELSVQQLAQLKGLGVQLHLDDFGIGQSSLGWLHRFPIDVLKINKSFLSRMTGNQKTAEIVKSIVALGHNLNMAVVAKGVETDDQLESIKAANFDYIQGYLLSEPLGKESAAEWLEDFIQVLEAQNV